MEATVSNQIIEVLDALCDKFGLAIDWGAQNVLPYAQELMGKMVSYELWTSVGEVTLFVFLFTLYIVCTKKLVNPFKKGVDEESPMALLIALFWVIGGIISIFSIKYFISNIKDIITCLTFPEKIVFEMMQSMMK